MHKPLDVTGKVTLHRDDFSHDAPGDLRRKPFEIVSRFREKVYLISHNYPTLTSYGIWLKTMFSRFTMPRSAADKYSVSFPSGC